MKIFLFFSCMFAAYSCWSQRVIDVDKNDFKTVSGSLVYSINGEPVSAVKYVRLVEGSPFFSDNWMQSIIILKNGDRVRNIPAKLDLVTNEIYFKSANGVEMVATQPAQEIVLMNDTEDSLFRFVHSDFFKQGRNLKDGWYQWLHSGKASLYKYFAKDFVERKVYGSATEEQSIVTKEKYFIFYNYNFIPVKNLKSIPSLLGSHQKQLEEYIKKQGPAASMDDRMADVMVYFNSLLPK